MEDTRNLGVLVVDMDNFRKDYPTYVRSWKNNTGEANYFSYATYDRYVSNSTITKNVSKGFKLNLGLFSVGNKKNMKTVFSSSIAEDINTTFGELDIIIRDSCHQLQISSNIIEKIKMNYLSDDFKDELYNTHPSEFFSNYGGFVITNYVMGGKATAVYAGTCKKTENNETKESNLNREINASYGFSYKNTNSEASGELNLGRGNTNSTSVTNEFSSIMMSIKTIGGNSSFASFSIPKEVKNTNVDLSNWINSINDKETHNIVDFGEGSLYPITDFIVEQNLKNQIGDYYSTGVDAFETLKEPEITINITAYSQPQVFVLGTLLQTRFGNHIMLKQKFMGSMNQSNFTEKIKKYIAEETERVTRMFGVKVSQKVFNQKKTKGLGRNHNTFFDFDAYNENYLGKVSHNGTIYVVSSYVETSPNHPQYGKKYALSIHNERFINEYAMREFIDRLPEVNISYEDLVRNYIINAL